MTIIIIILVTILISAFFSGIEIAFVSASKLKIEIDKGKGTLSGKILSTLNRSPSMFIGAVLLGNNIALVIYGIMMENMLNPLLQGAIPGLGASGFLMLLMQTLIATVIILIFAEFLPKALFRLNSNALLNFFAVPVIIVYFLLYPLVYFFVSIAGWIMKVLFKTDIKETEYVFSVVDLDEYIKRIIPPEKVHEEMQQELQMVQNALELRNVKLRECMVPRTEIIAVEVSDSIEALKAKFVEFGFSRILVFKDTIDHVIGYVHAFDMFKKPGQIESVMKSIEIVPETMMANEILTMFTQQSKNVAVVVDEFGGTSGMVTMEDAIEEIFGEIEDEFDEEELNEQEISDKEYILSARLEIDYLNDKYGFKLPESDEYETLAGLIIHFHESIPALDEEIRVHPFRFKILQVTETKIELIKLEF